MSRHSKNNTASAYFTYEERQKLHDYGTQEARLGRDSMRPYDSCWLCLKTASKDPVVCEEGHLACRQCLLESMLAQRAAIKAKLTEHAESEARLQAEQAREAEELRQQQINQFEAQQRSERVLLNKTSDSIASFWIPSKAPEHRKEQPRPPPCKDTLCLAAEKSHPISLKTVHAVHFSGNPAISKDRSERTLNTAKNIAQHICLQCRRDLSSNNMRLLVNIPCGHVICEGCSKVGESSRSCHICTKSIDRSIRLYKEGTGFAGGGGRVVVRKGGIAFQ